MQAVAGAVLMPNGMAMLRTHAPPGQLGRLNGINGAVLSFAAAAGPVLGAAVLAVASWRLIFPISVPFILVALALLPKLGVAQEVRLARTPFDWIGTALFTGLLVAITVQLGNRSGADDAMETVIRWGLTAGIAVLFVWWQFRTPAPAADWRLFRTSSFTAATSYTLLTNLTMYTTLLMIPFFVREVQGKGTALSGLLLGAMSIVVAITAPIGGRLSDTWGRRPSAQAGAVLMLVAVLGLLGGLSESVPAAYLAGGLALMGLGLGLGVGAANTAAVESVPRLLAGSAAGTSSMMRYIGSIVGAGLLAGVLSSDSASGDVGTFRLVMLVAAVTSALAVLSSTYIHRFADAEPSPALPGRVA
jgi:MFS family permease